MWEFFTNSILQNFVFVEKHFCWEIFYIIGKEMLLHSFFTFFEKYVCWYIQQWMLLKGALTWNKFTHFVRIFYTFRLRNIIPFVKKYFYICWEISFSDGACAIEKQWPPLTWNKFTSSPPPLGNLSNLTWNSIGESHKWRERDVDDRNLFNRLHSSV